MLLPAGVVRALDACLVGVPGAKRVVAVDVTGLPVDARVAPASTYENRASEPMLEHLDRQGVADRPELVRTLGQDRDIEVRRVA